MSPSECAEKMASTTRYSSNELLRPLRGRERWEEWVGPEDGYERP